MSDFIDPMGQCFVRALPALLLVLAAGCEMATDDGAETPEVTVDEANWKLVEAYTDLHTAWHSRESEISQSDDSADEKERRRKEERGEHPGIVLAVVAARTIIDSGGERTLDAARFLVENAAGASPTADSDIALANAALARLVGPDWSVVEAYQEAMQAWQDDSEARREAYSRQFEALADDKAEAEDSASEERASATAVTTGFVFVPPPDVLEATGAAQAILDVGADHERARDAAEFLVDHGMRNPQALVKAARWLKANAADFEDWPDLLMRLASAAAVGGSRTFDDFLTEMATEADNPVVRATARYFAATALADGVNNPSTEAASRETSRQRALALATGMSAGVENEEFVKKVTVDGEQVAPTMAEAEAVLVHGIRHTLVGSTVADEQAQRLDGTEDSLSAYAGKVVLMDFWATWCGPCIAALPRMRNLAEAHSEERFEILGISVDAELETVTGFMEDEPMPWAHWHVGVGSELVMSWNITGYPTYVVVDGDGVILLRGHDLDAALKEIDQALEDPPAP